MTRKAVQRIGLLLTLAAMPGLSLHSFAQLRALVSSRASLPSFTYVNGPSKVVIGQVYTFGVGVEQNVGAIAHDVSPPTGTISIYYGATELASAVIVPNDEATFSFPTVGYGAGTYHLTAVYSGDNNYLPSNASFSVTLITGWPTTTVPYDVPTTWVVGDTVSLCAGVSSQDSTDPYNGQIYFKYGQTLLGSAAMTGKLPNNYAVCISPNSSGIAPGTYPITSTYSGDAFHLPSSSTSTKITLVASTPTTTFVTLSNYQPAIGDVISITAMVDPAIGNTPPSGGVRFTLDGAVAATVPLHPYYGQGEAALTVSTAGLQPGTYSFGANYLGSTTDNSSTWGPTTINLLYGTATTLSISPNPVPSGTNVILTAKVSETKGSSAPTGTVEFSYNGDNLVEGTLSSNGSAQVPLGTGNFSPGTYAFTATYSGDANNGVSSATSTLTVR